MKYFLSLLALVLSFGAFSQPAPAPACPMAVCGDPSVRTYHDPILCTSPCATLHACVNGETPINTGIVADDIYSAVIPIGFTFSYYGTPHTQCIIGSNGMINFDLTLASTYDPWPIGAALLGNASAYNCICGPWCDMFPPAGGTITYATSGVAPFRRFTATWCHVPMYHPSICPEQWTTTQIILYECCNFIDVHVAHKTFCPAWNGGFAIIGVQNATGTNAVVPAGRDWPNTYNCNNEAWRFTPAVGPTYTVAAIPFAPVPNAASVINWFQGPVGGPLVGTGPTLPCVPFGMIYRAEVAGCDFVSTSVINVPPRGPISHDEITVCVGGSLPLPSLPPGVWSGGDPTIATINPLPPPGFVTGIMVGTTTFIYTYGDCIYELEVHVIHCGCASCHDCDDTCYWRVTGNNIHGTRNIFGTLSNDNIRIVTNNIDRAIIQAGGNMGIRQLVPSTTLDVDCIPVTAPSGLQFENLPFGHGNMLVVDPAGYVYQSPTPIPASPETSPDVQRQINDLRQQIDELRAQLGMTNPAGDNNTGNSVTATPNPTNGVINVSYTIAGNYSAAMIKITDNQGRVIMSKPVTGNTGSVTINLPTNIASGELIITLVVDGKIVARQKEVLIK